MKNKPNMVLRNSLTHTFLISCLDIRKLINYDGWLLDSESLSVFESWSPPSSPTQGQLSTWTLHTFNLYFCLFCFYFWSTSLLRHLNVLTWIKEVQPPPPFIWTAVIWSSYSRWLPFLWQETNVMTGGTVQCVSPTSCTFTLSLSPPSVEMYTKTVSHPWWCHNILF